MSEKHRWHDPANEGQIDYLKVGARMFAIIMLLTILAVARIGIKNNWFESFKSFMGY